MNLYTIQLAKHRVAVQRDIPIIDTTVKSGRRSGFAPTWAMVMGVKDGLLTETQYTEMYMAMLRDCYRTQPEHWAAIYNMPNAAIACYCRPGVFCHRHLLADALIKMAPLFNTTVNFCGELE